MLYSCPCLRRASLERLLGSMDHDLGDVAIAAGLVDRDLFEPFVHQEVSGIDHCVVPLHLLDHELDDTAELRALVLVYLIAVAVPDFVELEALGFI